MVTCDVTHDVTSHRVTWQCRKLVHRLGRICISKQTNVTGTLNKLSLSNADKEQLA